MVNLGINSPSIAYEVAIELLGQRRQPLMAAVDHENAQTAPSAALVRYYRARLAALDALQDELQPNDQAAIERIVDQITSDNASGVR